MEDQKLEQELYGFRRECTPHFFLIFSICVYSIFKKGHLIGSAQLSSVLQSVKKYTIIFAFTINKRKTEKWKTVALLQYTLGAFQSTKTSGLKFRQLLAANGIAFYKISKKEDNLAKYTQIFENFFRKFSFHSNLPAEFL